MQTHRFTPTPQSEASQAVELVAPTNSTDRLLPQALQATAALFRPGCRYYKVGVAAALVEAVQVQIRLFDDPTAAKSQRFMQAVDHSNQKLGTGSIKYAAVGLKQEWKTRLA